MKTILKQTWWFFILLGSVTIAFGLNLTGFSVITQQNVQIGTFTWTFYKLDVSKYLQNLKSSLDLAQLGNLIPVAPQIPNAPKWTDVLSILKFLVNTFLTFIANWLIYIIQIAIIMPLQFMYYPINIILSILGLNTSNDSWVQAFTTIYKFRLPQIPYL